MVDEPLSIPLQEPDEARQRVDWDSLPSRHPTRRRWPWVVAVVILVLGLGGGGAFAFVHATRVVASTLTERLDAPWTEVGHGVTVSGVLHPADSRIATLQEQGAAGAWADVGSTRVDQRGRFTIAWKAGDNPEHVSLRVVVRRSRHAEAIRGRGLPLEVLGSSTINASAVKYASRGKPMTISGVVLPPTIGRRVEVQESGDGKTWVGAGTSAVTDKGGNYTLTFVPLDVGTWQYRISVVRVCPKPRSYRDC